MLTFALVIITSPSEFSVFRDRISLAEIFRCPIVLSFSLRPLFSVDLCKSFSKFFQILWVRRKVSECFECSA